MPQTLWGSAERTLLPQRQKQSLHLDFSTERKHFFFWRGVFYIYCLLLQAFHFPDLQFSSQSSLSFLEPSDRHIVQYLFDKMIRPEALVEICSSKHPPTSS